MGLKVVGAGLGRTGTASLKLALEQLGIGRCYHMGELIQDPSRVGGWVRAADGSPDWDELLEGYSATVDYPACTFWRELADYYPNAKVLLSVRDANSWFDSVNETIMRPDLTEFLTHSPFGEMQKRTIWDTLDNRMTDRDFMVEYFDRRTEEIKQALPPERLLVYEVKEGWGPLCEFLDVPVPDADFPRVNSRDETRKLLEGILASGGEVDGKAAADGLFGRGTE